MKELIDITTPDPCAAQCRLARTSRSQCRCVCEGRQNGMSAEEGVPPAPGEKAA